MTFLHAWQWASISLVVGLGVGFYSARHTDKVVALARKVFKRDGQ